MKLFEKRKDVKTGQRTIYFNLIKLFSYTPNSVNKNFELSKLYARIEQIEKELKAYQANAKYELLDEINFNVIKLPKVIQREETLEKIVKNRVSVTRFGDGEFRLAFGVGIPCQEMTKDIDTRLQEILKHGSNENLLVCIPDIFGKLDDKYIDISVYKWRVHLNLYRDKIYKFLNFKSIYYDTQVTRPYFTIKNKENKKDFINEYFNSFKFIWKNKEIVIIEGGNGRFGVGNDLLNNTTKVERILCPIEHAYKVYDKILYEAKKISKDKLILISLGPTATILAYDLYKLGFWAIDIGHLDHEYEWFLDNSKTKNPVKKQVLSRKQYNKEVIKVIN